MQVAPEWYHEGFIADSRNLTTKIYCTHRPMALPIQLTDDDIADWDVVKELQDAGVPCAYIGYSSATVKLYNENNRFKDDPSFISILKRGVKIEIDIKQYDPSKGTFEIPCFTGWVDNYEFSDDGMFVTITAYDSLHYLKEQPAPWFRPSTNEAVPLYNTIKTFLQRCGLEESRTWFDDQTHWHVTYRIDKNLTTHLRQLVDSNGTVGDVLTQFAQAGVCAIFCDSLDVLHVELLPRTRHLVYQFDDVTQIVSSASSTTGYDDYTHVSVDVYDTVSKVPYTLRTSEVSYSDNEALLTKGANEYTDLVLRDSIYPSVIRTVTTQQMKQPNESINTRGINKAGPVVAGIPMPMLGSYIYICDYDYAMDRMKVNIWAAKGIDAEISVLSYNDGRTVGSTAEAKDEDYEDSFFLMKKTLGVDASLVTDPAYAAQIAATYAKMIAKGAHRITATVRGNITLELLDLVSISNPQAAHDAEQVLITRFHYTYDGSLACDIESLSYSAVMFMTYAFLSPGFYVPYDAGAVYITANCEPPEAGIIDGTGAYAVGDTYRLVCIPRTGWKLKQWLNELGEVVASDRNLVDTVEGSATFTAVMVPAAAYISLTVDVPDDNTTIYLPIMSLTPVTGTIDWGDGFTEEYDAQLDYEHTYQIAGTMEITLQAPIENLAFEIFANNSQINTFTMGSDVRYLPGGMFYNSSVRNVNLLPAQNIISMNSFTGSRAYSTISNMAPSGITTTDIINPVAGQPLPTVSINATPATANTAYFNLPKYVNTKLVVNANINLSGRNADTVVVPDVGLNHLAVTYANNMNNLDMHGPVENLSVHYAMNLTALNIPGGLRTLDIMNTSIQTININARAVYVNNISYSDALTDMYLTDTTSLEILSTPPQLVNIHVPEVCADIRVYYDANVNIIPYISTGGDNNGRD